MTFVDPPEPAPRRRQPPAGPRPPRSGRRSPLATTVLVVGAMIAVLVLVAQIWTEVLWFDQLRLSRVWTTRLVWQLLLFVVAGVVTALAVGASLIWAYRSRPMYPRMDDELSSSLDRYRTGLDPLRRLVVIALPVGLGLFAGSAASQEWQQVLLFLNGGKFGRVDPQFGVDVGFYVFQLPFLRFLIGFLLAVAALALIAGLVTHYLYGGIQLAGPGRRTTAQARRQLGVLGAVLLVIQAASYWLDRYGQLVTSGELITGAAYTAVHAVLPAKAILAMLAIIVALTFLTPIFTGSWRLPAMAVVLMLVASVAVGGIYPSLVQQLQVRPTQQAKEAPYIARNIEATRFAFGVDQAKVIPYTPQVSAAQNALVNDAQTTASIRILDPALVSPAFVQLERNKQYYGFPRALDVDRYVLDGQSHDTVIAARELNIEGLAQQQNWVNQHIVYTHGYGVVAAYGNQRAPSGNPKFFQSGLPSSGALGEFEQRIYFGEQTRQFSIVGAPAGTEPREIDYPKEGTESNVVRTTFDGDGGPKVGGLLNRLLFAIKFRDQNILLSGDVNNESQVLYDRTPFERVQKVAPFLTLDGDPYPAVVNGRVVWIIDGFTTSDQFPYSQRQVLGEITRDTLTATTQIQVAQGEVNYIRNSVKATVDAYDGKVTLYAWDEKDPILSAWRKALPGVVQPMAKIDGELMSHLRYPEDLFKVQRDVLGRYHVTDAGEFFSGQDAWATPNDPVGGENSAVKQPPYFLTLRMPEQDRPTFSLTSTYIPRSASADGTNALTGFLAANADAGSQTGVKDPDYGTLRLVRLPDTPSVPGPGQIQNKFNSDPTIQDGLNVLRIGDSSEVKLGNLLTLPVGGGLLYVQPAYVQSKRGVQYPQLRKVLVAFGDSVGYADTLDEALNQVFGGQSGAKAGDAEIPGSGSGTSAPVQTAQQRLNTALQVAAQALEEGNAALAEQDFAAYGQAQKKLADAISAATTAQRELGAAGDGASGTPSPTPGSSATATP